MKKLLLRLKQLRGIAVLLLLAPAAHADSLSLSTGFFDLSPSRPSESTQSVSALGIYEIFYRHPFFNSIEVGLGYSLLVANGVSGDLGYGIDIDLNYFPFTAPESTRDQTHNVQLVVNPLWRPFVGVAFIQRQFPSADATYAGFGAKIGTLRTLTDKFSIRSEFRYSTLGGSVSGLSATSIDFLIGVNFEF
jgi:hypothetical protein